MLSPSVALCPAGQERDANGACVDCAMGSYRELGSIRGCESCPDADFTTLYPASTSPDDCTVRE